MAVSPGQPTAAATAAPAGTADGDSTLCSVAVDEGYVFALEKETPDKYYCIDVLRRAESESKVMGAADAEAAAAAGSGAGEGINWLRIVSIGRVGKAQRLSASSIAKDGAGRNTSA